MRTFSTFPVPNDPSGDLRDRELCPLDVTYRPGIGWRVVEFEQDEEIPTRYWEARSWTLHEDAR
jgi:hypothetical protein